MQVMRLGTFFRSSTVRFVGLVFLIQLATSLLILFAVRHMAKSEALHDSRALIEELRADFLAVYRREGDEGLRRLIESRLATPAHHDAVILLVGPNGAIRAGNLGAWPPVVRSYGTWRAIDLYRIGGDEPERMEIVATKLDDGSRLLTGHVIEDDLRSTAILEEALAGALLLVLPLALLGALIAARSVDARIARITRTAEAVKSGDLSRRVAEDGSGDAFETLGRGINAMLDRIEALVSELRIVTDGLAHDLRSPLTRLKATLDRAVLETKEHNALGALEAASAEAETLLAMLSTALQISRAEAGIGRDRFASTDLGLMLADLVEVYGPLAEERGFRLEAHTEPEIVLPVNRELIGQALANLVDNALKYGGGRTITLSLSRAGEHVLLSVADAGSGIPLDRREEALRRFGRLDPARANGGAGLGLTLAAAVARLHGGELVMEDNAPGLRVTLRLPPGQ